MESMYPIMQYTKLPLVFFVVYYTFLKPVYSFMPLNKEDFIMG